MMHFPTKNKGLNCSSVKGSIWEIVFHNATMRSKIFEWGMSHVSLQVSRVSAIETPIAPANSGFTVSGAKYLISSRDLPDKGTRPDP
jgi:hypothetical protein